MVLDENTQIKNLIEKIRKLTDNPDPTFPEPPTRTAYRVISMSQTVLYNTVGKDHPLMKILDRALEVDFLGEAYAAGISVVELYDEGWLVSPRLAIAHEIEGDILDIAQKQVQASERNTDATHKQLQLGIAAFLAGAALEDALRRLCDSNGISYPQRTSISILQSELYQPSKHIEMISRSESKQITAWGETRNGADHGRFSEITYAGVLSMVIGVREFIDKHLP